jgi:transposase
MRDQAWCAVRLSEAQRAEVEVHLRRRDLTPRIRERLEMVKAVGLGYDPETIEGWSGRTVRTIRRWVGAFLRQGIAGLADAPRSGRPAAANGAYLQALERAVDTPPREFGLPFDGWTSARLSSYLAATTRVRITPSWLRHLLARRRFACGRPKHTLTHLQDPDDVARCERELVDAEKKWSSAPIATSSTTRMRPTWRRTRT